MHWIPASTIADSQNEAKMASELALRKQTKEYHVFKVQTSTLPFLLLLIVIGGCRCPTYYSQRVTADQCFSGVPAMIYKPALCTITWEKVVDGVAVRSTTQHYAKLPVMYSVDVYKAPFGKTTANFTMNDDGQLTSAQAIVDEEIPELITAIGNLAKDVIPSGTRGTMQTMTPDPALITDRGVPISFSFQEL